MPWIKFLAVLLTTCLFVDYSAAALVHPAPFETAFTIDRSPVFVDQALNERSVWLETLWRGSALGPLERSKIISSGPNTQPRVFAIGTLSRELAFMTIGGALILLAAHFLNLPSGYLMALILPFKYPSVEEMGRWYVNIKSPNAVRDLAYDTSEVSQTVVAALEASGSIENERVATIIKTTIIAGIRAQPKLNFRAFNTGTRNTLALIFPEKDLVKQTLLSEIANTQIKFVPVDAFTLKKRAALAGHGFAAKPNRLRIVGLPKNPGIVYIAIPSLAEEQNAFFNQTKDLAIIAFGEIMQLYLKRLTFNHKAFGWLPATKIVQVARYLQGMLFKQSPLTAAPTLSAQHARLSLQIPPFKEINQFKLSKRHLKVAQRLALGESHKNAAFALDINIRTLESRVIGLRIKMYANLAVKNLRLSFLQVYKYSPPFYWLASEIFLLFKQLTSAEKGIFVAALMNLYPSAEKIADILNMNLRAVDFHIQNIKKAWYRQWGPITIDFWFAVHLIKWLPVTYKEAFIREAA